LVGAIDPTIDRNVAEFKFFAKCSNRSGIVPTVGGLVADIFVEYLFRVIVRGIKLIGSHNWSRVTGRILSAECPKAGYGCDVATIIYEYLFDGAKFGGSFEKPFILHSSGEYYASSFIKGMDFKIRVNPKSPSISVHDV
jgi:hypothetical protein